MAPAPDAPPVHTERTPPASPDEPRPAGEDGEDGPATREHPAGLARVNEDAQALAVGTAVHLLAADARPAQEHLGAVARRLDAMLVVENAWALASAPDPAEAGRALVRDAVAVEETRIARTFAGRIRRMTRRDDGPGAQNVPPGRLELELETQEDVRSIHLEGAWAWNLHASGASAGDLIQIDLQHPVISPLKEESVLDGRVLDERRQHLLVTLGALDRTHARRLEERTSRREQATPGPADPGDAPAGEDHDDESIWHDAVRSLPGLLGTGERPPTGAAARDRTDRWVRRRLDGKNTRLVTGILLVTHADRLPEQALATLSAAAGAPAGPRIVLATADADAQSRLPQVLRDAVILRRLS